MKLSKTIFNSFYNSYKNDIVNEFYNKAFEYASNYDRVSAYFDSKILSLYAKGLSKIYLRNGRVRFVFSYNLSEEDYELMRLGYKNKEKIENELLEQLRLNELNDEEDISFSNLAFLIEIGLVDIRIAITRNGIFHDKFGLIYDNDRNYLYFRGSNNETLAAIKYSYESFETTCSWNNNSFEIGKIDNAVHVFNDLWENKVDNVIVIDIPDIVKNEIVKHSKGVYQESLKSFFDNKFIFDLDDSKSLIAKNLLNPNKIDVRDKLFKVWIQEFTVICTNNILIFKKDISYINIRKIITLFIDYGTLNDFQVVVTDKLKKYLNDIDIQINVRQKLGIDIKEKNVVVKESYKKFEAVVDNEMSRVLRDSQKWNAFHIISMIKSANFSVPGTGKTSIVYGAYAYLSSKKIDRVDKVIVVGPKNSFLAWKDEFFENFKEKKELNVFDIQERIKSKSQIIHDLRFESANNNLILVNYEMLEPVKEALREIITPRTLLVFDEGHKIKAINGVRAKAAREICKNAHYKVFLTGTPLPNSYQDIYNTFKILYTDEYEAYFRFSPAQLRAPEDRTIRMINEKIYPFYCRITKKDLNIPIPNKDNIIKVSMSSDEEKLFMAIKRYYRKSPLALYIRLLQASTNPSLLLEKIDEGQLISFFGGEDDEEKFNGNPYAEKINQKIGISQKDIEFIRSIQVTSKFTVGIDLIKKLVYEKKQVIVWGIFVKTLQRIKNSLFEEGIKSEIIDGSVPQQKREELLDVFKNNGFQVLITNPQTLAESVSLHMNCHDAVYFEYSFNLTHMLQSRDRINRLGLPEGQYTQYHYLMLENSHDPYNDSVDYRTYKRLKEKEDQMIESIEGTSLSRIDYDDLEDVIKILRSI